MTSNAKRAASIHEVHLPGCRVGELYRNSRGAIVFEPDLDWLKSGQRPRLGVCFLRDSTPRTFSAGPLPHWFENLLPEQGSLLRQKLAREYELRENDSFRLLSWLGGDLPGAVEIRRLTTDAPNEEHSEDGNSHPSSVEEDSEASSSQNRFRFSLAGMQLKFSMSAQGDRFAVPSRHESGEYFIVKLPGHNFPDLADVEAATMKWANLAGLDVPKNFAFNSDKIQRLPANWAITCPRAYAIRRFDRRPDGSRVHHEDFCQALEESPDNKYGEQRRQYSYEKLLVLVADTCGEEAAVDFANRLGFMIACGNSDAHLKNWSFEWGQMDRPKLSPCYDFVATISWPELMGWKSSGGPELAIKLGQEKNFIRLDGRCLQQFQERSGIAWAREAVMDGIEKAKDAWPSVAEEVPSRMRDAVEFHWATVPLLRDCR